jgi:hypothetical protein
MHLFGATTVADTFFDLDSEVSVTVHPSWPTRKPSVIARETTARRPLIWLSTT